VGAADATISNNSDTTTAVTRGPDEIDETEALDVIGTPPYRHVCKGMARVSYKADGQPLICGPI
jgi:hypothetical protein